ncbi:MAG: DNA replication initiation control protein YabA [Firmicutes bacterium ADurb.Bin456]|nr:MAG: DNA replication initiation control protein YabA [Firmicutes bacterium ADurb.Bin456]
MPSLLKRANELEIKLHVLLAGVRELKDKLREMEEENARLRKELAAVYREGCPGVKNPGEGEVKYRGFINLLDLYDQDYHICNLYFGRRREGECLFCMAFLRKEMAPAGHGEKQESGSV